MFDIFTSTQSTLKQTSAFLTQRYQVAGLTVAFGTSRPGIEKDNWFVLDDTLVKQNGIVQLVLGGEAADQGLNKASSGILVVAGNVVDIDLYHN